MYVNVDLDVDVDIDVAGTLSGAQFMQAGNSTELTS